MLVVGHIIIIVIFLFNVIKFKSQQIIVGVFKVIIIFIIVRVFVIFVAVAVLFFYTIFNLYVNIVGLIWGITIFRILVVFIIIFAVFIIIFVILLGPSNLDFSRSTMNFDLDIIVTNCFRVVIFFIHFISDAQEKKCC